MNPSDLKQADSTSKTPGMEFYTPRKWMSPSSLCNLARCPRKFFYSSGCRLCKNLEVPALDFGKAIHAGLPEVLDTGVEAGMEAFSKIWSGEWDDEKRSAKRARLMFEDFHEKHSGGQGVYEIVKPGQQAGLVVGEDVGRYEVPFAIDVGMSLPVVGRVDGLGRNKDTGKRWMIEWKTTSELGSRFMGGWAWNPQVLIYTLAGRVCLGEEVEGTIVEGLLVAKASTNTMALPIQVPQWKLERVVAWIQARILQVKAFEEAGTFPQDPCGCNPYAMFGQPGYTCEFEALCGVEDWTSLKDLYFVKEERETVKIEGSESAE